MIKFTKKGNQIVIFSEDDSLDDPEYFLHLTLTRGFEEYDPQNFRCKFVEIPDEINSDVDAEQMREYEKQCAEIFEIHAFFLEHEEKVELDDETQVLVEFEKKIAEYVGAKYACAINSAIISICINISVICSAT